MLSSQTIDRAEIVMSVRVVGGIALIDEGEADDKIIAVLASDDLYRDVNDLCDLNPGMVDRVVHYFATYKLDPMSSHPNAIDIQGTYDTDHAKKVVLASMADYLDEFPTQDRRSSDKVEAPITSKQWVTQR